MLLEPTTIDCGADHWSDGAYECVDPGGTTNASPGYVVVTFIAQTYMAVVTAWKRKRP
jgi:hypothetical protein